MRSPIFVSLILTGMVAGPGAVSADSSNATPNVRASDQADVHSGQIGIGLAVGHEWHIDERDGDQISLIARWRATSRLTAEIEFGKTEFDEGDDSRRLGGGLSYRIGNLSWLAPYIVAGGGAAGSERQNMYLEAGAGAKFPITDHFVLMLDVRSGHQFADDDDGLETMPLVGGGVVGGGTVQPGDQSFDYSRWRLIGMIYF